VNKLYNRYNNRLTFWLHNIHQAFSVQHLHKIPAEVFTIFAPFL